MEKKLKNLISTVLVFAVVFGSFMFGLSNVDWSNFATKANAYEGSLSGMCGDASWMFYPSSGRLVIQGSGYMSDYATHDDAPWKGHAEDIESVSIAYNIKNVGSKAFSNLYNLTTVRLPPTITHIGDYAFFNCSNLINFEISDGVTYIGEHAFDGCRNIGDMYLPDGVEYIGGYAFYGCFRMGIIHIPSNATVESGFIMPDNQKTRIINNIKNKLSIASGETLKAMERDGVTESLVKDWKSETIVCSEMDSGDWWTSCESFFFDVCNRNHEGYIVGSGETTTTVATTKPIETTTTTKPIVTKPTTTKPVETTKIDVDPQDSTAPRIVMVTPKKRTIIYGESITLQVVTYNMPVGARVKWKVSGEGVSIKPSSSGKTCKVTSTSNGNVVIKAYLVDSKGDTIATKDGKLVCDSEYLYSEVNLWLIIVGFLKQLFLKSDTVAQLVKSIY